MEARPQNEKSNRINAYLLYETTGMWSAQTFTHLRQQQSVGGVAFWSMELCGIYVRYKQNKPSVTTVLEELKLVDGYSVHGYSCKMKIQSR